MPASPHEGNGRAGFSGSTLYLCGAGNSEGVRLALTVNYRTPQWDRILLLDDDPTKTGGELCGVEIAGGFDLLAGANPATDRVANLVARTTRGRRGAREKIASFGIPFASMIDADVNSAGVDLKDDDTIVYHHATLGPEVVIDGGSVVGGGAWPLSPHWRRGYSRGGLVDRSGAKRVDRDRAGPGGRRLGGTPGRRVASIGPAAGAGRGRIRAPESVGGYDRPGHARVRFAVDRPSLGGTNPRRPG